MENKIYNYENLIYPFYYLYNPFDKKEILKNIKKYNSNILNYKPNELKKYNIKKFDNTYFLIKENFLKTQNINNITDYFSEEVRIKCSFGNYISPLEYWKKNKYNIIKKTLEKYKKINIHLLRETIYFNTKLCSNFRITVCMTILKYFNPKKWLDISAGWGDRLLSGIFCKIKYYESTDPNMNLHSCYEKIKDTFLTEKKKQNYIIHKNGFLEANIKGKNFDIVFTSPPFFTLEKYSEFSENSLKKYKTENEWINNFFIPSLIKSYNLLKKDGYMILYMGGSENVMKSMFKLNNVMKYLGIIYFYENKPRGIYVWKKISKNKIINLDI
jgi:hypothetical protein